MITFRLWRHWASLPPGMRRSLVTSVLTVILATATLYQTNVRSTHPPTFTRGGTFAEQRQGSSATQELSGLDILAAGASPAPAALLRSKATISVSSAPRYVAKAEAVPLRLPAEGVYTYKIKGYEEATGFGHRNYPDTMTMTVSRPKDAKLKSNEVVFDLVFSDQHEEREIVQYTKDGAAFTFEGASITFGAFPPQTSEATYNPSMFQIPFPLNFDVQRAGTSEAVDSDGNVARSEDWTDKVLGRETIDVLGASVDSWVTTIHRKSRDGSTESVDRTRQYWFDTQRMVWDKWTEDYSGEKPFGPGTYSYHTEFTATLIRMQPAS